MAYPLAQQQAQLAADHPLEASVGAGVAIGGTVAASAVASEVLLLRLASGLRWAGATRTALAVRNLTYTGAAHVSTSVRGLSTWQGAEAGLLGARENWQLYRSLPIKAGVFDVALPRIAGDLVAQGGANYIGSDQVGFGRVQDANIWH